MSEIDKGTAEESSRDVYEPPAMTVLGTIEDVTAAVDTTGQSDVGLKTGSGG
jgi:hypothetical protein